MPRESRQFCTLEAEIRVEKEPVVIYLHQRTNRSGGEIKIMPVGIQCELGTCGRLRVLLPGQNAWSMN